MATKQRLLMTVMTVIPLGLILGAIKPTAASPPPDDGGYDLPTFDEIPENANTPGRPKAEGRPERDDDILGISATRFGVNVVEALQYRISGASGVPNSFSNVLGAGFVMQLRNVEVMPTLRMIYSFTKVSVKSSGDSFSANAEGLGYEFGARIAITPSRAFFIAAFPAFGSWTLNGQFRNGETFDADVTEFSTEFMIGWKVAVSSRVRLDLHFSLLHIGFRPGDDTVVDLTSYPTIGLGFDWLPE